MNIYHPLEFAIPWVFQAAILTGFLIAATGLMVRRRIAATDGGVMPDEGVTVHIRPCDYPNMRAHCEGASHAYPVTSAFARNRAIVEGCDVLIAAPPTAHELPRGGTWYTIRHARKRNRKAVIIAPDGRLNTECAIRVSE